MWKLKGIEDGCRKMEVTYNLRNNFSLNIDKPPSPLFPSYFD